MPCAKGVSSATRCSGGYAKPYKCSQEAFSDRKMHQVSATLSTGELTLSSKVPCGACRPVSQGSSLPLVCMDSSKPPLATTPLLSEKGGGFPFSLLSPVLSLKQSLAHLGDTPSRWPVFAACFVLSLERSPRSVAMSRYWDVSQIRE